jgi:DNA-binding NarL/FixJ family response regulator
VTDASIKVLIVDDSRLTRVNIKTTLSQGAPAVRCVGEAEDGQEALQLAGTLAPDVVLMDIGMPILDGIRATQQLRERFPRMKVIMLTSHENELDILEAFRAGAASYCLKETSPDTLMNAIEMTAKGGAWIDPKIAKVVLTHLQQPTIDELSGENSGKKPQGEAVRLLTERETEVLTLITEGLNNMDIAERLCISMNTVKTHLKNIFQKLEVEDRTAAALKALKDRIV